MHFFHPIQQCAQQIYHTALPLSPTSSCLQNSYLQSITDNQLSHVTAFIGAPRTWGLLLRTIKTRPRKLTCITTSGQGIIAGCEDIVNIYDAVTGLFQQSLSPSEPVTKIQASPDGSTLFFAHSSSVTMWDVQTGGLIHTFTKKSKVNEIAVSISGNYFACGLSNCSVSVWNTRTKKEGKGFWGSQPIVAICWLPPQKLVVTTQSSLYIHAVTTGETLDVISIPNHVWGMVYCGDKDEFLVGTLESDGCSFRAISSRHSKPPKKRPPKVHRVQAVRRDMCQEKQSPTHPGQLTRPTLVGKDVVCITLPMGVRTFNTSSHDWTNNPPLLNMAASVTVSLNRNLVVQTMDSIKIFSTNVLTSGEAHNDTRVTHVHPLDKNYIICVLQPTRHIAVLELETLREAHFNDEISPLKAWWSNISLQKEVQSGLEGAPWVLHRLSPARTKIITIFGSTLNSSWEISLYDTRHKCIVAGLSLESGGGTVYDLTFASETRFYLKIYGPGQHFQIPCDITNPPWDRYRHMITEGKPITVTLSELQAVPPYILDANCEWVLDARSRKICWISPGDLRRGDGGHFWAGQSLVMVGDDGVVRKVSFREPDC